MFKEKLELKTKHVIEHDRPFQAILIKGTSLESKAATFKDILVSVEISIPGQKKIVVCRRVSIDEIGLFSSRDGFGNNNYNIDVRPDLIADKGWTHYRMLNLTPDGNINLDVENDEKVIITFENTNGWVLDVSLDQKTYMTNKLLTLESETIREGQNVNYNVRGAHAFLANHSVRNSEMVFEYANNTSITKSIDENTFTSYVEDYVGVREFIRGDDYPRDRGAVNEEYIIECMGVNPLVNVQFDEVEYDFKITQCIIVERVGDSVKPLTKIL